MEETSHTTVAPAAAAPQTPDGDSPASAPPGENAAQPSPDAIPGEGEETPAGEHVPTGSPGFSERGRMRRRARFLRKARELAYRDLGGLVFDLHRYGRRNDTLVLAKLDTIGRIDGELRALEASLAERQAVTVLREAGVAACPRCAAIHGSDDRFCPQLRPGDGPPRRAPGSRRRRTGAHLHSNAAPSSGGDTPSRADTRAGHEPNRRPCHTGSRRALFTLRHPDAPGGHSAPHGPETPHNRGPSSTPHGPDNPTACSKPTRPGISRARVTRGAKARTPRTTPPAGPAPTVGDSPAEAKDHRPNVDQPTEIVRPPAKTLEQSPVRRHAAAADIRPERGATRGRGVSRCAARRWTPRRSGA